MKRFAAIIAAGGSAPEPIQQAESIHAKGEIVVGGIPCVSRVAQAVVTAGLPGVVVGSKRLAPLAQGLEFVEERETAIQNFRAGADALPDSELLLFLPSDAPFLTADCLLGFCDRLADQEGDWLSVGICGAEEYRAVFPESPKKSVRLREGRFHTGALYAGSRSGFLTALDNLEGMFRYRRSQFAMAKRIGVWQAARFGFGRLTIPDAELAFRRALGVRGVAVTGCDPCMVPDIDDLHELAEVRAIAARLS